MIRERSNPKPLHNFALPRLRRGNQKQTRCMKAVDHSAWPSSSSSSISAVQRRSSVLPSFVRKRLAAFPGGEEEEEEDGGEGIEAVREKLMLDLRAETDKIKKELLKGDDEEEEETVAAPVTEVGKKLVGAATAARHEEDRVAETRPWSLRTRRAACKTLAVAAAMDHSPARKECVSVALNAKGLPEKGKERVKFAMALKKKEIKEDFVKLTGHQPPRRPKKRRCTVQKKLDMLFPGLWLTEVTADAYKVVEVPDNCKLRPSVESDS